MCREIYSGLCILSTETFRDSAFVQIRLPEMASVEGLERLFRSRLAAAFEGHKKHLVAEDIDVDATTISRWLSESAPREPGIFSVKRAANRLGVTVAHLLGEADDAIAPNDREKVKGIVSWLSQRFGITEEVATAEEQQPRTVPEWTPEFPVSPEDFIGSGDGDYPLFYHAWNQDDHLAAAGPIAARTENPMSAILNSKEVREGRVRTIKVQGNSMSPSFEDGWIVAVDVALRQPKNREPVAVYRPKEKGMIIGRWERRGERVRLLKDNDKFKPVELEKDDLLVGTITKIIDHPVPPPPKRRKK